MMGKQEEEQNLLQKVHQITTSFCVCQQRAAAEVKGQAGVGGAGGVLCCHPQVWRRLQGRPQPVEK